MPDQGSASGLTPLDAFPLRWRWTDPRHRLLNAADLQRIRPLTAAHARAVETAWRARWPTAHLFPTRQDANTLPAADLDEDTVRTWLRARLPPAAPIHVSWTQGWAVLTDTDLFTTHWPSFCYPSSDDAVIAPPDLAWALTFHHEEAFHLLPPTP
ncbi:hypothetical protein [Muricoccus radiodurans]|uniref:hypothetical protein n=1 Tax=Muricoccus radiodurans TaxID=2231721 RepID=UPI003CEE2729